MRNLFNKFVPTIPTPVVFLLVVITLFLIIPKSIDSPLLIPRPYLYVVDPLLWALQFILFLALFKTKKRTILINILHVFQFIVFGFISLIFLSQLFFVWPTLFTTLQCETKGAEYSFMYTDHGGGKCAQVAQDDGKFCLSSNECEGYCGVSENGWQIVGGKCTKFLKPNKEYPSFAKIFLEEPEMIASNSENQLPGTVVPSRPTPLSLKSDNQGRQTYQNTEEKYDIRVPANLELFEHESGFGTPVLITNAYLLERTSLTNKNFVGIRIYRNDYPGESIYDWVLKGSMTTKNKQEYSTLKNFETYSNGNNIGYRSVHEDEGSFLTTYLVFDSHVYRFQLSGMEDSSSYLENPEALTIYEEIISTFKLL